MKIDQQGGTRFTSPADETWQPTMYLAFMYGKLHQMFISSLGRTRWRPVVEMDPIIVDETW